MLTINAIETAIQRKWYGFIEGVVGTIFGSCFTISLVTIPLWASLSTTLKTAKRSSFYRRIATTNLALLISLISLFPNDAKAAAAEIEFRFVGYRQLLGTINAQLTCKARENERANPISRSVPVLSSEVILRFPAQFVGMTCSMRAYQDLNTNGKLDTNIIGIPKEPYGF